MKILILCLIALLAGWHLYIGYRDYKSTDNPIPFNVLTVYDRTTYKKMAEVSQGTCGAEHD
ncbi:MAG: hypothetical protein II504_03420 [Clostridia bacterium]|nr:hypothetical protein [Clostridia bacterium]